MSEVELTPGDGVAYCVNCGVVVSDKVAQEFPNNTDCPECGTEFSLEKVVEERRTVDADVVA